MCTNNWLCMQIRSLYTKLLCMLHSCSTSAVHHSSVVHKRLLHFAKTLHTCCINIVHLMQLLCIVHLYQYYWGEMGGIVKPLPPFFKASPLIIAMTMVFVEQPRLHRVCKSYQSMIYVFRTKTFIIIQFVVFIFWGKFLNT